MSLPLSPPALDGAAERRAAVERLREMLRRRGVGAAVLPALAGEAAEAPLPPPAVVKDGVLLEGLRPGALVVVTGPRASGKASLALGPLAEASRAGELVAVVDGTGRLFPPALALLGAELSRVLVLRATGVLAAWAGEQVLGSGLFAAVALLEPGRLDRAALRRLQLAAERSGSRALLVSREAGPAAGLVEARLEAEALLPLGEARLSEAERSPVSSPPRRCRARLIRRGERAPRTVEVELRAPEEP